MENLRSHIRWKLRKSELNFYLKTEGNYKSIYIYVEKEKEREGDEIIYHIIYNRLT